MTTPIQKIALDKLKQRWTFDDPSDNSVLPEALTDPFEPVEMTQAEANALRGWLKELGLSERDRLSVERLKPAQFSLTEQGDTIMIFLDPANKDFDKNRDVAHFSKPTGDVQKYNLILHRDDYSRLQMKHWRDGWFSQSSEKGPDWKPFPFAPA